MSSWRIVARTMREPGGKHVTDLLALAQKASGQVLRFHDRKGAIAATTRNEALGATGRGRELGSRLPQFRWS